MQNYNLIYRRPFQIGGVLTERLSPFLRAFPGVSALYLHDVQTTFFMFLLLPQTSLFSTYSFSGLTLPVQLIIQSHISSPQSQFLC